MPERLIRLMQLKSKTVGVDMCSDAIKAELRSWDNEDVEEAVTEAIKTLKSGEVSDTELCPFCVQFQMDCDICTWAQLHGCCIDEGSLYNELPKYGQDAFAGINKEEALACLRD